MPPAAKRDCGIILFDMNASNKEEALAALMKLCTFNWLSCNKNSYRVILSNTKESANVKNYSNLYDTDISDTDPQPILHKIENAEAEEGDWLNALLLAIHHLKRAFDLPGVITLQILYITKLDGCSQDMDMSKVEEIVNDLNEYGIYLYIIGPDVKLPYTITSNSDVSDAMEEATLEENNPTLTVAKRIIDSTNNSVMCDLKVGINLFFSFRNSHGTQPWKLPLSFGTALEIPACTVKIYKKGQPFNISRKINEKKYVLTEDESISVEFAELVAGIERHGKFVKAGERDMFKIDGPKTFAVIGFTDSQDIPEYYMRGKQRRIFVIRGLFFFAEPSEVNYGFKVFSTVNECTFACAKTFLENICVNVTDSSSNKNETFYVLPDEGKPEDCCQAFYNLVDVLAEEKKYAIVKRVYYANTKPKFFVLVPQPDLEPKCFVMSVLPYADDLTENFRYSDSVTKEPIEDKDFEQFFDSIDIWGDDCKLNIPLGPKMMLRSYTSKLACEAAKRYLERDFAFEKLNDSEDNETNEFLEAVKESWPSGDKPPDEEPNDP